MTSHMTPEEFRRRGYQTIDWIAGYLELFEGEASLGEERVVATRVSLPSDRSFSSFDEARAHITG